jgi:putative glutamine amidotransferase
MTLRIALSQSIGPYYEQYAPWLRTFGFDVTFTDLNAIVKQTSGIATIGEHTNSCDGLVLVGGKDITPALYRNDEREKFCQDNDAISDVIESTAYVVAKNARIPILGICRGAQLINILEGGTLLRDISKERPGSIQHDFDEQLESDRWHSVLLKFDSFLQSLCGAWSGEVNSAHHQACLQIAPSLQMSAVSADGIVEAIEYRETKNSPFLLGVQWHPERMPFESPFSRTIGIAFLRAAKLAKEGKR